MLEPQGNRPDGGEGPPGRSAKMRGIFFWTLMFVGIIMLVTMMKPGGIFGLRPDELRLDQFYHELREGRIEWVKIGRNRVEGGYIREDTGTPRRFTMELFDEQRAELTKSLVAWNEQVGEGKGKGKPVQITNKVGGELLQYLLLNLLPWVILFLLFWFLIVRQLRSAGMGGGLLAFGRSRAKLANRERVRVTFDDVAGIDEAKEEVREIVEFLKNPAKFRRLGGRIPRGVLLVGSPGTGKTLLAKAIAGEADVPFFSISGSDFVEMFVGVGASRVRDLFRQAKENAPCIVFLDEIDAVGRRRGAGLGGGHDEREQTLNAILVEMDGFDRDDSVIVIAATNRPDVLDPALLRPGRFDRQISVDLPDIRGREEILKVHARRYKLAPSVNLHQLARGTPTFSGADLEAVLNEAALLATRRGKEAVEMEDLEEARDKVRWGRQRRSLVMDEEDRRITAFHEAGHALLGMVLPYVERPHKVTIVPQGHALGATLALPEKDRYHYQRRKLLADIAMLLGGRAAEELFCGDVSSGAQNDLERATELARAMVCRWGMSEVLGPISYHEGEDTIFLGREITRTRTHGEAMAVKIDEEIHRLITSQYERARQTLKEHETQLRAMAEALLKHEVLYAQDLEAIMAGQPLARDKSPLPASAESEPRPAPTARAATEVPQLTPKPKPA